MLTLNFQTPKEFESKISHHLEVVFFPRSSCSHVNNMEIHTGNIELFWEDYDANGDRNGITSGFDYHAHDFPNHKVGDRLEGDDGEYSILRWSVHGYRSEDVAFIMNGKDYSEAFNHAQYLS